MSSTPVYEDHKGEATGTEKTQT